MDAKGVRKLYSSQGLGLLAREAKCTQIVPTTRIHVGTGKEKTLSTLKELMSLCKTCQSQPKEIHRQECLTCLIWRDEGTSG